MDEDGRIQQSSLPENSDDKVSSNASMSDKELPKRSKDEDENTDHSLEDKDEESWHALLNQRIDQDGQGEVEYEFLSDTENKGT